MKKEKLFKVMLSGALACLLVMTSITPITSVVAQETTENTGSDNTELKRVEYDGSLESQEALERETGRLCVVVKQGVKTIDYDAFGKISDNIVEVELPEGLEKIGGSAFCWCENLEKINIPSTVTEIGEYAFGNCDKLTSVTLPDGLKELGEEAFPYGASITWKGQTYQTFRKFNSHFLRVTSSVTELKAVSGLKAELEYADMKSVIVSWSKVKNATQYQLEYADNKNFKNAKIIKTKKLKKELTNLKKGKKYYFKVRAVNDDDSYEVEILYSPYSAVKTVELTLKACNKKIKENYLKTLKKGRLNGIKINYFKIVDFDKDGLLDLFVAKGKKDFNLCGYTAKHKNDKYDGNHARITEQADICESGYNDKYNKCGVNLKKGTITTCRIVSAKEAKKGDMYQGEFYKMRYLKNDKDWTDSLGIGKSIECSWCIYNNKNTYDYCPKGKSDSKKVSKKTYEKVKNKLKKNLKWHSFMVKNNAKNRAKYCK